MGLKIRSNSAGKFAAPKNSPPNIHNFITAALPLLPASGPSVYTQFHSSASPSHNHSSQLFNSLCAQILIQKS